MTGNCLYVLARNQYHAEPILDHLAGLQTNAERVLGVADLDLFTPGLNFLCSQAQNGGRAAVVALARLHPEFWDHPADPPLLRQRAKKAAVHEVGHTYGLRHCTQPTCVMSFSTILADTDDESDRFCPAHEAQLTRVLGA